MKIMDKLPYTDPTSDFGFKRILACEPNKDLLISFINELFHRRKTIAPSVLQATF
jgi:hypothetical protein